MWFIRMNTETITNKRDNKEVIKIEILRINNFTLSQIILRRSLFGFYLKENERYYDNIDI